MKKESIEEAYDRIFDGKLDRVLKAGFIEGTKWQQEQDKNKYSEEEVLTLLTRRSFDLKIKKDARVTVDWFEQFKKK